MTDDVLPGPFGRIEPPEENCHTTFICLSSWKTSRYIHVDGKKGTLKLRTKLSSLPPLPSGIRTLDSPTKIKIKSLCDHTPGLTYFYVSVYLFVFPSKFGDRFLNKYSSRRINEVVAEDTLTSDAIERSSQLHRMMRMVSEDRNPEAHEEMMASVKVKTALEGALNKILKIYIPKYRGNVAALSPSACR